MAPATGRFPTLSPHSAHWCTVFAVPTELAGASVSAYSLMELLDRESMTTSQR